MHEKNPNAVALGKMGGSKGGKNRAAKLTPEQRSASARNAAVARWAKTKKSTEKKKSRASGRSASRAAYLKGSE